MVKQKQIIGSGFLVAFFIIVIQFYLINTSYSESSQKEEKRNEHIELAELMFHNQRYMDKLYFSGLNKNWEAAEFYRHEIEENMEALLEGNIFKASINISKLAEVMYTPASLELENAIVTKDADTFLKGYKNMVNSCNSCHAASNLGFIKIILPESPTVGNQEY